MLYQQGALNDHKGLTANVQQLTGRQASIAAQVQVTPLLPSVLLPL